MFPRLLGVTAKTTVIFTSLATRLLNNHIEALFMSEFVDEILTLMTGRCNAN
jgi:hypothetical protein